MLNFYCKKYNKLSMFVNKCCYIETGKYEKKFCRMRSFDQVFGGKGAKDRTTMLPKHL